MHRNQALFNSIRAARKRKSNYRFQILGKLYHFCGLSAQYLCGVSYRFCIRCPQHQSMLNTKAYSIQRPARSMIHSWAMDICDIDFAQQCYMKYYESLLQYEHIYSIAMQPIAPYFAICLALIQCKLSSYQGIALWRWCRWLNARRQ